MSSSNDDKFDIIRNGDTLSMIANRNGIARHVLISHNNITDVDKLYVGQRLSIPKLGVIKFRLFDLIGDVIAGLECKVISLGQEIMHIQTDAAGALPDIHAKDALATYELWVKRYAKEGFKKVGEVKGGRTERIVAVKSGKLKIVTQTRPTEENHVTMIIRGGTPEKSGVAWVAKFPASTDIGMLETEFGKDLQAFIAALKEGGVTVRITTTYRPPQRSYLMYWAKQISDGAISPEKVTPFVPEVVGDERIDIDWAHLDEDGNPDLEAAKQAAKEMLKAFGVKSNSIAGPYKSNHNFKQAKAVDMTLWPEWGIGKTVKNKIGDKQKIETKDDLFEVGKSYGVTHFDLRPNKSKPETDNVHWSRTGA